MRENRATESELPPITTLEPTAAALLLVDEAAEPVDVPLLLLEPVKPVGQEEMLAVA